jgi:hypothetical protein
MPFKHELKRAANGSPQHPNFKSGSKVKQSRTFYFTFSAAVVSSCPSAFCQPELS